MTGRKFDDRKSAVEALLDYIRETAYGGTVTYEDMGKDLGLTRGEIHDLMHDVRPRLLRDYRKAVQTIINIGYHIVFPRSQDDFAYKVLKRGQRVVGRAKDIIDNVNIDELKPHELRVHQDNRINVARIAGNLNEQVRKEQKRRKLAEKAGLVPAVAD